MLAFDGGGMRFGGRRLVDARDLPCDTRSAAMGLQM